MADLSGRVPFHSGQVNRNFCCPGTSVLTDFKNTTLVIVTLIYVSKRIENDHFDCILMNV